MDELAAFVIGNGFVKTWSARTKSVFASALAVEQAGIDFAGFKASHDFVIEYNDQRLAIGEAAWRLARMRVTQMDRSRVGSEFYRQLFAAALVSTFKESGSVSVVLTLPVQWYAKRDDVKEKLKGRYEIKWGKKVFVFDVEARNIRIVPEGFGVLAGEMLDDHGCIERREVATATVGIVEIGTGTTDLSLFNSLELVPVRSKGLGVGLRDVWEGIRAQINEDFDRDMELHEVDQAIQRGFFKNSGETIHMDKYIKAHMPNLSSAVSGEMNSLWDGGRMADGIYFAGGGAPPCYPYFRYAHGKLVDESYSADAHGAFLYGLFRSRQGNK